MADKTYKRGGTYGQQGEIGTPPGRRDEGMNRGVTNERDLGGLNQHDTGIGGRSERVGQNQGRGVAHDVGLDRGGQTGGRGTRAQAPGPVDARDVKHDRLGRRDAERQHGGINHEPDLEKDHDRPRQPKHTVD